MSQTVELNDELVERIERHLEDDETVSEFVEELVAIYEQEGRFLQEGA
jgi:ferritin-like metal-binding protein YciE